MSNKKMMLPKLTVEEKWQRARVNLVYFLVSGIAYAKSMGKSAEDFGTFTGNTAVPKWANRGKGIKVLIEWLCRNKQQFSKFQMEILSESDTTIEARMKGFGTEDVKLWAESGVTVDDYVRFFGKKWEAIAKSLGVEYKQRVEGDWTYITASEKR